MLSDAPTAVAVWINELHYDNSGTDVNEGVEMAGTAGLDLNGWSIVAYNGANGTAYKAVSLSGIVPDERSGYGIARFDID